MIKNKKVHTKTIEQQIEDEIAILKNLLDQLAPFPAHAPANQNCPMTSTFNASAQKAMKAYIADLPRRMGLERCLLWYRRRLNAIKIAPELVLEAS